VHFIDVRAAGPACVYGCVFVEPQKGHTGRDATGRGASRVTQASSRSTEPPASSRRSRELEPIELDLRRGDLAERVGDLFLAAFGPSRQQDGRPLDLVVPARSVAHRPPFRARTTSAV